MIIFGQHHHNCLCSLQDLAAQFAGREVSLAILEVARSSRKVVCSLVKAKENDDLRQLEVSAEARVWHGCLAEDCCVLTRCRDPVGFCLVRPTPC